MTGAAFFLLRMLGRLSLRRRRRIGARLGDIARLLLRRRRRVAARNLAMAFPEFSAANRRAILRRHFRLLGAVFVDECAMLGMSEADMQKWMRLDGEDELSGQSIILCAPHFVAAGTGGVRLSARLGRRITFHYRPLHSRFWDLFYRRLRQKFGAAGVAATAAGAMRACARSLQRGDAVFYLPDADVGMRKSAVFAPFLGVSAAMTTTTTARLAAIAGAQVRIFTSFCTEDGYDLRLSPPLADFPSGDVAADARRINELIGAQIRRDPAQYYWLHRRFKTRPEGEAPRYA